MQQYAPALLAGSRLPAGERQSLLNQLEAYTGVSADYWDKANLRLDESQFSQELLRKQGRIAGRVDSRFTGDIINGIGETMAYDPMTSAIGPAYLAAFMDYYYHDLGVKNAADYVVSGDVFNDWDWSHRQPDSPGFAMPFPNTSIDLAYAMKQNPTMKVLVQQGYFDLATPHLATSYYMDHLEITDELRGNIHIEMYQAGHMMYIHEPSMRKYKSDLARFVRESY